MFVAQVGILHRSNISLPSPLSRPHRVLLRLPWGKGENGCSFGPWTSARAFLVQYAWKDGTPILHTSTAQLRNLQTQERFVPHLALAKWEAQLQCPIPHTIWSATWLNFRSANENMFMWQLLYRIIATQRWRFPMRPTTDPTTWCTRCTEGSLEDVAHCIWSCPLSAQCWRWGDFILQEASNGANSRIEIKPEHVFVAHPLPSQWQCPERLWHVLKAILCWQIWKNRNEHYMADQPADAQRVIRKAWARLGIYLRKEWSYLGRRVTLGRMTATEAEALMYTQYG